MKRNSWGEVCWVQQRADATMPTFTQIHTLALASKINTLRMKQKKIMCVDTEFQIHEYQTIDSHRECILSRIAPSSTIASKSKGAKTFDENASRVMLNESHSWAKCGCCCCSLWLLLTLQHLHTHTNSSAQSPATRSAANTQIVEATLETENVTRVYTLPHRNEIPHKTTNVLNITNTQHLSVRAARTLSVQFGLVLLRSVNFDFFITTNFLYCWILNSVDIWPTCGSHVQLCCFYYYFSSTATVVTEQSDIDIQIR